VYSSTTILNLSSILCLVEGVGESRRWGGSIYTWHILGPIGLTPRLLVYWYNDEDNSKVRTSIGA
jgi:hypothetical protein